MPLSTEVGLGPGDTVVDEDPASPRKAHSNPHPTFRSIVTKRLDGSRYVPLGTEVGLGLGHTVLHGNPPAPRKEAQQLPSTFAVQTVAHVYCGKTIVHLS